jgi:hypothetical protein
VTIAVEFRGSRNGVAFGSTVGWEFELTAGRRGWNETAQPAVLTMSVVWSSTALGVLSPNNFQLGNKILLEFRVPAFAATWHSIFAGGITDIIIDRDVMTITAVDYTIASLGRTWIDVPAQSGATMTAAATAVVSAAIADGALPAGVTVAYDGLTQTGITFDAQTKVNALQFLNQLLDSEPSGCLATRFGANATPEFRVQGYSARRISGMPSNLQYNLSTFSAAIDWDWRFTKKVADVINSATVTYNDGTASFTDTASVASIGTYTQAVTTQLDLATNADYLARRLVIRNNDPGYRLDELTVDMRELSATVAYNFGRYTTTTGALVTIPALYTGAQTQYFLEGFRDQIRYSTAAGTGVEWRRTMYISDIGATAAAQRYQDVTSGVRYSTVNPTYRWIDLEEINI